ncbi:MAG: hypothetical protein JWO48_1203 [Bryobacterales bacterium]|nr:hypothetical protein [Bryobacterales bacterium]
MPTDETVIRVALAVGGGLFSSGVVYATMRLKQEKDRTDINGLGKKHWRLIAMHVRQADTQEKRDMIANVIEGK